MTTILTAMGWEDENGNLLGTWTNQANVVNSNDDITVAEGVKVNTLAGNDRIGEISDYGVTSPRIENRGKIDTSDGNDTLAGADTGDYDDGEGGGIDNSGTISTGKGCDLIWGRNQGGDGGIVNYGMIDTSTGSDTLDAYSDSSGDAIVNYGWIKMGNGNDRIDVDTPDDGDGLRNEGTIDLGNGNDTLSCQSEYIAIINYGMIETGNGGDNIFGNGFNNQGILNSGTIDTGNGNDTLSGIGGEFGINNSGTIETGNGNDTLSGIGGEFGINNSSTISTGNGNDTVDAHLHGFTGNGTIDLGDNGDLIRGFGAQVVEGGHGFDTAELGKLVGNFTLSNASGSSIDITYNSATMTFTNVEQFVFVDGTFTLSQLQDLALA